MTAVADDPSWSPTFFDSAPSRSRVDSIAFVPMGRRLRNELITQCYGDISDAMAGLLGHDDATWATYGHWASRTIGQYLSLSVPGMGERISRAFGYGNRDVFADIGRAHTTFLETVGAAYHASADLDEAWDRCETALGRIEVEPPGRPGAGEDEFWNDLAKPGRAKTNRLLVLGFGAYRQAIETADAEEKSHLILLGNAMMGLHEQKRLSVAISMGFRNWLRRLTTIWRPMQTNRDWSLQDPGRWRLRLENWWISFATKRLIAVELPEASVKVGKPVPPTENGIVIQRLELGAPASYRQDSIENLHHDIVLGLLYDKFDVTGESVDCWNDLSDRMSYIIALFASTQRSKIWFDTAGKTIRVPQWEPFDAELKVQAARLATSPTGVPATNGTPSPLTDAYLDSLRQRPTYPLAEEAASLSFGAVHRKDFRSAYLDTVRADVSFRYDTMRDQGFLLDPKTARVARRMFGNWNTLFFMALLFRSLPDAYAAARGVRVIGAISDLATDPFRRASETARFVDDLLKSDDGWRNGQFEKHGAAYTSVEGVRAIHAIAASQLLNRGWDSDSFGMPLNQEDVLGTALSFAVPAFEMLEQMGLDIDDEKRDAYTQFWLGVGYLLGAPLEAVTREGSNGRVPLTYREGQAVAQAIRRRHHARSFDGVRLSEALLEGVGDGFPKSFDWLATGLIQAVGDPDVVRILLAGQGEGRRRSQVIGSAMRFSLRSRVLRRPTRSVIRIAGERWLEPFMDEGVSRPYRRPRRSNARRQPPIGTTDLTIWPLGCSDLGPSKKSD